MGIRFHCPNGHRLNVKTFQAGKRGVCPHCGAKFIIPNESALPSSRDDETEQQLEMASAAATDAADALAESPDASWYVAPPEGGRMGPAKADLMRVWLAEGRVTADSLVWREGWDDWIPASAVFAQVATKKSEPLTPEHVVASPAETPLINVLEPKRLATPRTKRPAALPLGRRRRAQQNKSLKLVGLLTALVVVLAIVFFWVIKRS
jgi:hypothetical protein